MTNYKELFYISQAEIASIIDSLDELSCRLKQLMIKCEDDIIETGEKEIEMLRDKLKYHDKIR